MTSGIQSLSAVQNFHYTVGRTAPIGVEISFDTVLKNGSTVSGSLEASKSLKTGTVSAEVTGPQDNTYEYEWLITQEQIDLAKDMLDATATNVATYLLESPIETPGEEVLDGSYIFDWRA